MIRLEPLTGHHDRSRFDCGVEALDTWLKRTALQHQRKGISRTFVALADNGESVAAYHAAGYRNIDPTTILGFYALASAFVLIDDLPADMAKRFPRNIPVTRLGRLAVQSELQRQGLGRLLLADGVNRARDAARLVGSAGIIIDAKDDTVSRFYQVFGFRPCAYQPLKLFLPMW